MTHGRAAPTRQGEPGVGHRRSRAAGGAGLGLAVVEAVVTAHGGTVAVTSSPGRTAFAVTFAMRSFVERRPAEFRGRWAGATVVSRCQVGEHGKYPERLECGAEVRDGARVLE
ncbi:hypothetical protein DY245_09605 [Streptomyces inhibens]|uniref:Histidine kinase/HSP90-like ATPase domain-containing protein n=1 Tax=Streptomyces inhibens TaxID=2293571 RepID=A0A371Q765_STRIH|nr:hypothetical protein DY245_09605 [Streptomyces inhibens]